MRMRESTERGELKNAVAPAKSKICSGKRSGSNRISMGRRRRLELSKKDYSVGHARVASRERVHGESIAQTSKILVAIVTLVG